MQLCLHNRKSQWLKNNVRYHWSNQWLLQDIVITGWTKTHSLISCTGQQHGRDLCRIQINPQHNSLKTTSFEYIIYKHSTFWCHKVIRELSNSSTLYCNVHGYTQNFVMAIVTLKATLNEKVGYHFCQLMLLF